MINSSFNNDWEFTLTDCDINAVISSDYLQWQSVSLPHDWSTQSEFEKTDITSSNCGYVRAGIGWYRKYFNVIKKDISRYVITFDGIYRNSTVYVNGNEVASRHNGYIGISVDITDNLINGLNIVAVKCDNTKEPSSRWYNGCGITRNVWMSITDNIYISRENCYLTSCIYNNSATINVKISPVFNIKSGCKVSVEVFDANCQNSITEAEKNCNYNSSVTINAKINNPKLWCFENPYLYTVKITCQSDNSSDILFIKYGLRTVEWISNKGLLINGIPTKLKGVCNHHDGGCVGSAVPYGLMQKRVRMLKDMGCNAIRTSHNPFSPEFYDICDKNGIMVIDECFDGWETKKALHDYGEVFEADYEKDLSDFVKRDRNHACVIAWSVGNEVLDATVSTLDKLKKTVKLYDDTRIITCGVNGISDNDDLIRSNLDVAGYNDGGGACFIYAKDHKKRPEQLFYASEAPHTLQTRGFYRTLTWWRDKNQPRIEIENLTENEVFTDGDIRFSSSYDNCGVRTSVIDSWELSLKYDYLCGEFRWTGFDYLGEAQLKDWPMRCSNSGIIDSANFVKDHYYLYQSMWTQNPMIHILPHWTHRDVKERTIIPVCVYTTCKEAEIILNGKSYGRQKKENRKQIFFNIPYLEGNIKAIGYNNDTAVCECSYSTALSPCINNVTTEISDYTETDGTNFGEIICTVKDCNDNFVPDADILTSIHTIDGLELLGSDNGCPVDMTILNSPVRKTFNGLCMYAVKLKKEFSYIITSLIGEKYFKGSQIVTISSDIYNQDGMYDTNDIVIKYTVDTSDPFINGILYSQPFEITQTSNIRVCVLYKGKVISKISDTFINGKKEPVIDTAHLNFEIDSDVPSGPFSEKLSGNWIADNQEYLFDRNGEFIRIMDDGNTQKLGYWWYDFPLDFLETPDYAGQGEIWFSTGEKCKISFTDQKCNTLVFDNSKGAISTAYGYKKQLEFTEQKVK